MAAVIGLVLKLGAVLAPMLAKVPRLFVGGAEVVIAAVTALPALLQAIGSLLKTISESPMLAFMFGALVIFPVGLKYGLSWDKPLRERAEQRAYKQAIDAANARADIVIARQKAAFDKEIAQARARIAQLEKTKAKR